MGAWQGYLIFIAALGGVFFLSAVLALRWAVRNDQFKKIDKGATVIFDEEEPEGVHTDFFPGETEKGRRKLAEAERKSRAKDAANT